MSKKDQSISYAEIDRSIRRLKEIEPANTLLPGSFDANVQRAVRIYGVIKPILAALASLPLIPSAWQRGVALFKDALDAVAAGVGGGAVTNEFKAGKDL